MFRKHFANVKNDMVTAWGGIVDALSVGEWALAFRIAVQLVKVERLRFTAWLAAGWRASTKPLVEGWYYGLYRINRAIAERKLREAPKVPLREENNNGDK
jgi:hypothetical protein